MLPTMPAKVPLLAVLPLWIGMMQNACPQPLIYILFAKYYKKSLKNKICSATELTLTCTESQKNQHGDARTKRSLLKKVKATFKPTSSTAGRLNFDQEQLEYDTSDHSNRLELKQAIFTRPIILKTLTNNYNGCRFFNIYGVPGVTERSTLSLFFGKTIINYPENITSGLPKADRVEIKCELKEGNATTADKFTYQAVNCCPYNNCCNCYCTKTTTEVDGSQNTKCSSPMCSICLWKVKKHQTTYKYNWWPWFN
jgi:hypothetical protein